MTCAPGPVVNLLGQNQPRRQVSDPYAQAPWGADPFYYAPVWGGSAEDQPTVAADAEPPPLPRLAAVIWGSQPRAYLDNAPVRQGQTLSSGYRVKAIRRISVTLQWRDRDYVISIHSPDLDRSGGW